MKIHKYEIIICDPNMEDADAEEFKIGIENGLTNPIIHWVKITSKDDKKEWYDNHPLNFGAKKADNYFNRVRTPSAN